MPLQIHDPKPTLMCAQSNLQMSETLSRIRNLKFTSVAPNLHDWDGANCTKLNISSANHTLTTISVLSALKNLRCMLCALTQNENANDAERHNSHEQLASKKTITQRTSKSNSSCWCWKIGNAIIDAKCDRKEKTIWRLLMLATT